MDHPPAVPSAVPSSPIPAEALAGAELLVRRDMPAERLRSSAVEILDASRRLARLIDDLLSVSRMESGRLVLDPRPLDLAAGVERSLSPFRAMAARHTLRTSPGTLPTIIRRGVGGG
jgi:signal transduction histidine kinase